MDKLIILVFILIIFCLYLIFNRNKKDTFINYKAQDFKKFYDNYDFQLEDNSLLYIPNNKKLKFKEINPKKSKILTGNKNLTKKILKESNLPIPNGLVYDIKKENIKSFIEKINNKLRFPLVVKPINQQQGIDVHLDIENNQQLEQIINKLSLKYNKLIIEEYVEGLNYRILLVNHNIIDIIIKENAYVIGNGENTIKELLIIKNKNLISKNKNYIKKTNNEYIKKQGYNLNSVLEKDIKIYVTRLPRPMNGGKVIKVDINSIHKDNIKMFIKTTKVLNSIVCGIDYISKDISKSYKKQGNILEANSDPHYSMHKQNKKDYSIVKKILKNLKNHFIQSTIPPE